MLKEAKNKAIENEDAKTKVEEIEQEYHFAGGLEYQPQTVLASSLAEAEKIWQKTRVKIEK